METEIVLEDISNEDFTRITDLIEGLFVYTSWEDQGNGKGEGRITWREGSPMPAVLANYCLNINLIDDELAKIQYFQIKKGEIMIHLSKDQGIKILNQQIREERETNQKYLVVIDGLNDILKEIYRLTKEGLDPNCANVNRILSLIGNQATNKLPLFDVSIDDFVKSFQ